MKVAVSSSGNDLNSSLDPRFGRCAYFLVIDLDDMSFEILSNENSALGGGAGIQSAQLLASKGVDAVITGNCGPNAVQTLSAAGIELFTGQTGPVKKIIERFKKEELKPTREADVGSHFGMASETSSGAGERMGGGGGLRQEMGDSRRRGRAMEGIRAANGSPGLSGRSIPLNKGSDPVSNESDLEILKKKADDINKQLEGIIARINKLETGG